MPENSESEFYPPKPEIGEQALISDMDEYHRFYRLSMDDSGKYNAYSILTIKPFNDKGRTHDRRNQNRLQP